jgi:hypothetical protein
MEIQMQNEHGEWIPSNYNDWMELIDDGYQLMEIRNNVAIVIKYGYIYEFRQK